MVLRGFVCLAAALLVADGHVAAELEERAGQGRGPLEGKWSVVRAEKDGKPLPEKVRKNCFVTFRGNWMTFLGWDGEIIHEEGKFVLGAKGRPPTIDVHDVAARKANPGIYGLKGNRLTLCFAVGGTERPRDFKAGPGRSLLVLERFEP